MIATVNVFRNLTIPIKLLSPKPLQFAAFLIPFIVSLSEVSNHKKIQYHVTDCILLKSNFTHEQGILLTDINPPYN